MSDATLIIVVAVPLLLLVVIGGYRWSKAPEKPAKHVRR